MERERKSWQCHRITSIQPTEILLPLAGNSAERPMSGSLLERKAHLLSLTVCRHFRVKSTFKTEQRKPCKHAHVGIRVCILRIKVLVYLHAKHETEKFKDTCSLWEKWFHLQPAAGKWGSYTHVLTHCHPQAMRKIPNCSSKSHSQGRTSAAKLFLAGSMGVGEGSGLPPHAVRLPAPGRHQVRAHSEVTEP